MEAVKEMESVEKIQAINKTSWIQRMKSYKRTPLSFVLWLLVNVAMIATVAVLAYLIVYILVNGVPYLNSQLFELKYTSENASVFPAIINTLIMTVLSLVLAVPLGIFAAIYLVEYAKRGNKLVEVVRLTAETLSGIPSIVYGLFGMLFFVKALGWGLCLLSGAALRTVFCIILPSAVPGILSGVILGIGRIVGETAALMYTAGTIAEIPANVMGSGRTLALHMYVLSCEGLHINQAYATAVVLLLIVLVINAVSSFIAKRITKG